ncbi:MAG: cell division topological specificity factor MinE [Gammaproteobacteria bacterium]
MSFLDYFRSTPRNTASTAKERLQIIIAHERRQRSIPPDYLESLQQELIEVIAKYVRIDTKQVKVGFEKNDGSTVLEVNIPLPENDDTLVTSDD